MYCTKISKKKHDIKEGGDDIYMHLHRKRMIVLVDRRHLMRDSEDVITDYVWMYEPPSNCRDIPIEPVPEWHISASKTCLLPNMDYGTGIEAEVITWI